MPKPFQTWTVLPHKPIEKLEENLWYVSGKLGNIQRMMTVARLPDGRLVVYNAIALEEPAMKELEAWGTPAFMIIPNGFHRVDAKIWKDRYPKLTVVAPEGARKKAEELVKVDRTDGDFGDPSVTMTAHEFTLKRDAVMTVRSKRGVTLVFNDLVGNMRHGKGFGGFMFRMLGFTGPVPKVPPLPRMLLVKDRPALKRTLEELAATPDLVRVIVSHGHLINEAPAEALRHAAATA